MFERHRRGRLDPRAQPATSVIGVACAGVGRSFGSAVAATWCHRVPHDLLGLSRWAIWFSRRVGRTVGGTGVKLSRTVRDGPALLKAVDLAPADHGPMEDELVASGRFVRIETRGERSGLARPVTVGFVEDQANPGAILVAAGSAETSWARNLLAEPSCRVATGARSFDAIAEPLAGADHARAIRELILRYGTPAEGLGHGTSFRLSPVGEGTL